MVAAFAAILAAILAIYTAFWKDRTKVRIEATPIYRIGSQGEFLYGIKAKVCVLKGSPITLTEAGLVFSKGTEWQYEPWEWEENGSLVGYDYLPRGLSAGGDVVEHELSLENLHRKLGVVRKIPPGEKEKPPVEWWFRDGKGHTYKTSIMRTTKLVKTWRRAMGLEVDD